MKKPFVFVVVPFKSEIKLLLDMIYSLFQSYTSGLSFTLVLWDDGSQDNELDYLYRSIKDNFSQEVLIIKHDNIGYTKQVYDIVDFAKNRDGFDYLLLANSDIRLGTGSFHAMVSRMNSNANIAAVGGKIIKMGTRMINHTGTTIKDGKIFDPYCGLDIDDPSTKKVERRLWTNGCCTLYNLDILRKENLNFDLEFTPAYFEESDLMTRLNMMGYSILYEPRAIIDHVVNATMGKERDKFEKVFWANWQKYLDKWSPYFNSPQLYFQNPKG